MKIAFAAALLALTAGCYMPDEARAQPPIEVPALLPLSAKELALYTGDITHDRPLVCASRFNENVMAVQRGFDHQSLLAFRYGVHMKLDPAAVMKLEADCEMFDLGILYYIKLTNPPVEPTPPSRWQRDPNGVKTSFDF